MPQWDPVQYAQFGDERARPFHDLLSRVTAQEPADVVDLGCGPATLTATLLDRWPGARVTGVDSSPEMVARARALDRPGLRVEQADVTEWLTAQEPGGLDVVVSNALLQWVPRHEELLPDLVGLLRPGGWLAVQIPGNHDAPSHALLRELARQEPFAAHTAEAARRETLPGPADYLQALTGLGCRVEAWETTYLHVLPGADPVFEWVSGTGARPVLQALPEDLRADFEARYREALRAAYPRQEWGTVLPFRRVFVVAQRG